MAEGFTIQQKIAALQRLKVDLPKAIAESGQLYFQKNFDKQQWDGKPWAPRKKETKKTIGKHILVGTGALRQSLQNSIIRYDWKSVEWGVNPLSKKDGRIYAGYLNYGTDKMPAREFIGGSKELNKRIISLIKREFNKVFSAK